MAIRRRLVESSWKSIGVKHFFHLGPPFALLAGFDGLLHGHHHRPPFLGSGVRCHFCHVRFVIRAMVFEIAEQEIVLKVDRELLNVAFANHVQDVRPYSGVMSFVLRNRVGLYFDDRSVSLHLRASFPLVSNRAVCFHPVISSGRTARFSTIERYSANTTCKVFRLSRPLVSASPFPSIAIMSEAMGPMNASGIHMESSRAENQYPGLFLDINSRVSGRPVG